MAGQLVVLGHGRAAQAAVLAAWQRSLLHDRLAGQALAGDELRHQLLRRRGAVVEISGKLALQGQQIAGRLELRSMLRLLLLRTLQAWRRATAAALPLQRAAPLLAARGRGAMQSYVLAQWHRALAVWLHSIIGGRLESRLSAACDEQRQKLRRRGLAAVLAMEDKNAQAVQGLLLGLWRSYVRDRRRGQLADAERQKLQLKVQRRGEQLAASLHGIGSEQALLREVASAWLRRGSARLAGRRAALELGAGCEGALLGAVMFEWCRTAVAQRRLLERNAACQDLQQRLYVRGVRLAEWRRGSGQGLLLKRRSVKAWEQAHAAARAELRAALAMRGGGPCVAPFVAWRQSMHEACLALEVGCARALMGTILSKWSRLCMDSRVAKTSKVAGHWLQEKLRLRADCLSGWHLRKGTARLMLSQIVCAWLYRAKAQRAAQAASAAILGSTFGGRALMAAAISEWLHACWALRSERNVE
ncbi:unnamed protein product, partial [Polarella glacialis]